MNAVIHFRGISSCTEMKYEINFTVVNGKPVYKNRSFNFGIALNIFMVAFFILSRKVIN